VINQRWNVEANVREFRKRLLMFNQKTLVVEKRTPSFTLSDVVA
jgi:hypothetical protein